MGADDQKVRAYSAIIALLESRIVSRATRRDLEKLRDKLEKEMAADKALNATASWSQIVGVIRPGCGAVEGRYTSPSILYIY